MAKSIDSIESKWTGFFDVITLFDVFEHLICPLDDLRRLTHLLRPGGILMLSTGDMDAWTWALSPTDHWYLQTPLHISFGSRRLFRLLGKKLAMSLVRLNRIPHTFRSPWAKLNEAASLLHWTCMRKGGIWRIPQRFIQLFPCWSTLRHRQSPPWTMGLRDHLFVIYQKH